MMGYATNGRNERTVQFFASVRSQQVPIIFEDDGVGGLWQEEERT